MKYSVILFTSMLFAACTGVYGQAGDALPLSQLQDSNQKKRETEQIVPQKFDPKIWKEIVGTTDYSEGTVSKKTQQDKNSTYSQSTNGNKRVETVESEDSDPSHSSGSLLTGIFFTIIVYTLVIAIIGYILFLILKNISVKSNVKITKTDLANHSAPIEDIKELEIDRLLREAMASGNYRLAIRIYFLGMLKKLDEDGFINWKKDKTNRDYLSELVSKGHYVDDVKHLTLAYEQVWYGEHNFPVQTYEQIISSFKAINQKLKASNPE